MSYLPGNDSDRLYEPSLYTSRHDVIMDKCTLCGYWTNVDNLTPHVMGNGVKYDLCSTCLEQEKPWEEVSVCPFCEEPTVEQRCGDEGWTFCSEGCGCLEGEKLKYKYACPKCGSLVDEPSCNCNK